MGDEDLVRALRAGDEDAFRRLVGMHHRSMVSVARQYVPTDAIAEDVAQETWLAVVRGLDGFEGRSSIKTWIFRILVNRARTRGVRESRTVPMSSLATAGDDEPSVDPDRFHGRGHPQSGGWAAPPSPFSDVPAERLVSDETQSVVARTIQALPANQRDVITLRDIHGWTSEEVCSLLEVSEVNQRVLLHRARSKVRAALEQHLSEVPA